MGDPNQQDWWYDLWRLLRKQPPPKDEDDRFPIDDIFIVSMIYELSRQIVNVELRTPILKSLSVSTKIAVQDVNKQMAAATHE